MSMDHSNDAPLDENADLEKRLREIEGALQEHMPEDQRLQSSIPEGRGRFNLAYDAAPEATWDAVRPLRSAEEGPVEPSFADFYERGVADVDPEEEVLGKPRRAPAQPVAGRRKPRSVDSLKQILAELGAGPAPPARSASPEADERIAFQSAAPPEEGELDERIDESAFELQPGVAPLPPAQTEAQFLLQSGLTDAKRIPEQPQARPVKPAPAAATPGGADDFSKALAMTQRIRKPAAPASPPPADVEAVQAYLDALQEQIPEPAAPASPAPTAPTASPAPPPAPAPSADEASEAPRRRRRAMLAALAAVFGAALIAAAAYIAYLWSVSAL